MDITRGRPQPLGSIYDGEGTNFSIFSSVATKVEVCFFDDQHREQRVELPGRTGSIWHGYVQSIRPGQRYGFRVHGPWEPVQGHLCCPNKLLLDPYCKEVEGNVQWHDSLFPGDGGSGKAGRNKVEGCSTSVLKQPCNIENSEPFMPKSVVVDSIFDWEGNSPLRRSLEDTVIYEVHVKGFTIQHSKIPPEIRGTYAGLAHPLSIKHLTRLGITAVELMPVHQFIHRRRLVAQGLRNYWGYDPICYFAPHNEYASDRNPGGAVKEFKQMVKAFHEAGIEVILDVVFNHTAEGNMHGPVLSFKGIDNHAYYWLQENDRLVYMDTTGTQNTLNCWHPQVRQMIIDSLRYWAADMHIDGFRFDLGPSLVREGGEVNLDNPLFKSIRSDPVLSKVKLIAEPWDIGDNGYQLGRFPAEWSEWNDKYRDDVRDFWNGREGVACCFPKRFVGSPDIFSPSGRHARASVNFVTCHDGFTLQDLVSYQNKCNAANKENNRDGLDDNHAWNCGTEGPTTDEAINSLRARQKRNFIATLFLSQGVPMLLGGDELGRTQQGNNNAYCQDNDISWFDWNSIDRELFEFVAFMIGFRMQRAVFRRKEWLLADDGDGRGKDSAVWHDAAGHKLIKSEAANSSPRPLQVFLFGRVETGNNSHESSGRNSYLILFNPMNTQTVFKLPCSNAVQLWSKAVDTFLTVQTEIQHAQTVSGSITLAAHSLVVLIEADKAASSISPE